MDETQSPSALPILLSVARSQSSSLPILPGDTEKGDEGKEGEEGEDGDAEGVEGRGLLTVVGAL